MGLLTFALNSVIKLCPYKHKGGLALQCHICWCPVSTGGILGHLHSATNLVNTGYLYLECSSLNAFGPKHYFSPEDQAAAAFQPKLALAWNAAPVSPGFPKSQDLTQRAKPPV